MYDESFSFRLCEAMRNISQHSQLPIQALSAHRTRQDDGTVVATQLFKIDRLEILRSHKINARIRSEVAAMDANIPIESHINEYFERLATVYLAMLREILAPLNQSAQRLDSLIHEMGDPMVTPIYFSDQGGDMYSNESFTINLVDPHLHAVHLIRSLFFCVGQIDFETLDAQVQAHERWPTVDP